MFYLLATVGVVAFAFAACVMVLILIDHRAREVIQQLPPKQGQALNVQGHGLHFPTGDNQ